MIRKLLSILSFLAIPLFMGVSFFLFVFFHAYVWDWFKIQPFVYGMLIWASYCLSEGYLHAYYYANKIKASLSENFNEHPLFVLMRVCVMLPLFLLTTWKIALCYCLLQPFLHNGMYYFERNNIDGSYPNGWLDQSTTSIALTTKYLTPVVRILMFSAGITGIVIFTLNK